MKSPFSRGKSGPWKSQLRVGDVIGTGTVGLRTRRFSAAFTAVGIAIGIASMVAVMGILSSSRANLLAEIDSLGTNLLQVRPGQDLFGESANMSVESPAMVRRIAPVEAATSISEVKKSIQRSDIVPSSEKNSILILGSEANLASTLAAKTLSGRVHDEASIKPPTVVLGSVAAERLGIADLETTPRVWIRGEWFAVRSA